MKTQGKLFFPGFSLYYKGKEALKNFIESKVIIPLSYICVSNGFKNRFYCNSSMFQTFTIWDFKKSHLWDGKFCNLTVMDISSKKIHSYITVAVSFDW